MSSSAGPTRFLHTPGIGTTTYLIADTVEGRALAINTPEDSPHLRRQRRMRRTIRPLAFLTLGGMGFVAGDFLAAPHISDGPLLGGWGFLIPLTFALAMFTCQVFSTEGHALQEHLLHSRRDIAQPLRYADADITRLPMTVRGVPTLTVLSRAADTGNMGAVYTELAHPGRVHSDETEATLADLTHP